mmetsp:Transcript_110572/g.323531  ORF Transcript_110572/g.323531 Transcript_110572/m.323531 type:complete len:679 (+) Transcript_110572:118-2154(+)
MATRRPMQTLTGYARLVLQAMGFKHCASLSSCESVKDDAEKLADPSVASAVLVQTGLPTSTAVSSTVLDSTSGYAAAKRTSPECVADSTPEALVSKTAVPRHIPDAKAVSECNTADLAASEGATAAAAQLGARGCDQESNTHSDRKEDGQCRAASDEDAEVSTPMRVVKMVYSNREDTTRMSDKLKDAMEELSLDPHVWRPVGPPSFSDANGKVKGRPNPDTIVFPLTVEVELACVMDDRSQDDSSEAPEEGADECGLDDSELGRKNPFDSGMYTAPVMTEDELQRFTVPFAKVSEKLRETLDQYGIAIVTDVIPEEELVALEADFAKDLHDLVDEDALREAGPEAANVQEAYGEFQASGPRAFPFKDIGRLTAAAGFSVKNCISHGRFAWRARGHPNVLEVYRAIYPDAGKLVSSMDVTFFTPEGQPPTKWNRFSAHVDQNMNDVRPGLADLESYQGVVYVWPSTADGNCSTTVVWPGSHRSVWQEMMKDEMFVRTGEEGFHYSEIKEMQDVDLARKLAEGWSLHARRALVPRGGLFLWNSRTVHTGWRGGPRLAQTVCFEPADRRPEAERLAKLRLAALGLPSTHWASAGMQHDIILGDAGYAALRREDARRRWDPSKGLPLRQAIRPAGLTEEADLQALAKLVRVEYRLTGMWDPPEDIGDLLDASVKDEIKSLL